MDQKGFVIEKSPRIDRLVAHLYAAPPVIEADRAELLTESYRRTEALPVIRRRSAAFAHILRHIPIVIRPDELVVGSNAVAPRGCQVFPEYSFEWLQAELDTVSSRAADPFFIAEDTKARLRAVFPYWKGKTVSDLAAEQMDPHALDVFLHHGIFTVGNYFYNGVGHVCVDYQKVLRGGLAAVIAQAEAERERLSVSDADYARRRHFLEAVMESCEAVVDYARRYSRLAAEQAAACTDPRRRAELETMAETCAHVPLHGARNFREACQSFWFIQQLLQLEASGHSISPGRFDQYMYPFYEWDMSAGRLTREQAQELIDCLWVKLNDLNKVRDAASAEGFAGYGLFQNLIVGGQDTEGKDATNDLSFLCLEASMHVRLPQPSLSVRVWEGSPNELLLKAAAVSREGMGVPAYYNDEIVIPAMMKRGIPLKQARDYCIIGCVEPQVAGKTDGWHDAAFFNMCRPLELVFSNGCDKGKRVGPETGTPEQLNSFEKFFAAYQQQEAYQISLMVNADNAVDTAHALRCPLPFESCLVDNCLSTGKSVQEGGAQYNFTGPQGFGIANVTDALWAVKALVYDTKTITLAQLEEALRYNFGRGFSGEAALTLTAAAAAALVREGGTLTDQVIGDIYRRITADSGSNPEQKALFSRILEQIESLPKYGNDIEAVDLFAREVAYTYTKEVEKYKNPRGGVYQAGLYPVSANVPLGAQTGATPDGRLAFTPIADGVGPASGRDTAGPTAAANSVAKLDHIIASNGTLFNQKFHPSALAGQSGLQNFVSLIRGFFDQKGMQIQFNVVSRETLIDAQQHPEQYKNLVVRVAGYSALFTSLSRALQDDIINRTEQGGL
ncbi:MAG: glycyl radical protein [Eubacteriales bacterium]